MKKEKSFKNSLPLKNPKKTNLKTTRRTIRKKGTTIIDTQVSPSLQNNPFAVVNAAGGLQTQQEIQAKKNAKKGEVRNQENNELQKERGQAPLPPKVAPKPKTKPNKKKSKKAKENEPQESSLTTTTVTPSLVNPQIIVACAALAFSVLSYFLLL